MTTLFATRSLRMRYIGATFCATFLFVQGADPINMQAPFGQSMKPGAPITAANDPFSPENIAQVAEEIGKLSPEQQEQLYKESLDFLSTELKMSPEEVEKMIMDEFVQGGAPAPEQPMQMPQQSAPARETTPTKAPEKVVPVKDLADAATLLKNLANITDTIMRKASGLPDLPSRVDRWSEQRLLQSWQKGVTWARFKQQLELLVQKAGKLQTRDPKTEKYLYLPGLLNNVSLKNNLENLYRTLKRYNELFVVSGFGIDTILDNPLAEAGSLSTEAKDALINILSAYAESFYAQNMLKEFDALIEKFDPTAKKLREEEEAAAKKALEKSKEQRANVRVKTADRGDYAGASAGYYGDPASGGGYYPGSGYNPSSYGYNPYGGYGNQPTDATKPDTGSSGRTGSSKGAAEKDKDENTVGTPDATKDSEIAKKLHDEKNKIIDDIHSLGNLLNNETFTALSAGPELDIEIRNATKKVDDIIGNLNNLDRHLTKGSTFSLTIYKKIADAYSSHKTVFKNHAERFESRAKASNVATHMAAGEATGTTSAEKPWYLADDSTITAATVVPPAPPLPAQPSAARFSEPITPEALQQAKRQLRHVPTVDKETQTMTTEASKVETTKDAATKAVTTTEPLQLALQILAKKLKALTDRLDGLVVKSTSRTTTPTRARHIAGLSR